MSAEISRGGPGLPRAELRLAEGGGGGLNAVPPTQESGGREGCVSAAAAAFPQVNGRRAPATGGASSRGTPRGSLGLIAGRRFLGQVRGASPRSLGERGEGPGRDGANPAPSPGSGAPRSPRSVICRVTTRKRGCGAKPLACCLTRARGALAPCSSPPKVGLGAPVPVPSPEGMRSPVLVPVTSLGVCGPQSCSPQRETGEGALMGNHA